MRHGARLLGLVAPVIPVTIYLAHVMLFIRHVNDDAFITFRYSRFFASGLGPYFNIGEHVEGYSNFLLMLLMTPVYALGGEAAVPIVAKALGIVSGGLALIIGYLLARQLATRIGCEGTSSRVAASLGMSLVAVFPGFALNCTSGLETGLAAGLIMLALWLGMPSDNAIRWRGAALVWAMAALTRPEIAVVFAASWIVRLIVGFRASSRTHALRWLIVDGAIVGGVVGLHLIFRLLAYDGEWLPNTYYAKTGGYMGRTAFDYVRSGGLRPFFGIVGIVACIAGWSLVRRSWRWVMPVATVAVIGICLPFWTGSDWMPGWRFSVPYLAPMAVIIGLGWMLLLPRFVRSRRVVMMSAALALLIAAGLLHHAERREFTDRINLRADGYRTGHEALASWILAGAIGPGDCIALMDIGIIGYRCPDIQILDITGLTDRTIAEQAGPFLSKLYDPGYVLHQEPELIVLAMTTPGDCRQPLPASATLRTWTDIEHRLLQHPEFQSHYRRRRPVTPEMVHWTDQLAARIGAERVFEHAHPGQYYLLGVFRRASSRK